MDHGQACNKTFGRCYQLTSHPSYNVTYWQPRPCGSRRCSPSSRVSFKNVRFNTWLISKFLIQCANVVDLTGLCGLIVARKSLLGWCRICRSKGGCERLIHLEPLTRTQQLVLREALMKRGFKILSNTNRLGEFWKIKLNSLRMELPKSEVMNCQLRTAIFWSEGK